jgi:alpha/beta superfamily hydrolase
MAADCQPPPDPPLSPNGNKMLRPRQDKTFFIPGPAGHLEALLTRPADAGAGNPIAVVCHPHPLYGGSMSNKVVHTIARAFNALGVATLRFNFRGVGGSQGHFDHGVGEMLDLEAVVAWLREQTPHGPLWLAGFSFGAFIAYRTHADLRAARLLLVAPPVTKYDFSRDAPVSVPWMVIQGGRDEVVDPQQVAAWVRRQSLAPVFHWMADADHYFHGRLIPLREAVTQGWGPQAAS